MQVKIFSVHVLKLYRVGGRKGFIAPLILNLGTTYRLSGQPHTHRQLNLQEECTRDVLNRRLSGPQSWPGLLEKRKISCPYRDLKSGLSIP
jgi:hypothetical protein